jgi:hypothetical protein
MNRTSLRYASLIAIFALGFSCTSNAQILLSILFGDKLNSDKLEFGLTVGHSWSTISDLDEADYTGNFNLGLYLNLKMNDNMFLRFGALPKSTWGAEGLSPYSINDPTLDVALAEASVMRKIKLINVPILWAYQTNDFWGFEIGPQVSLRLKGIDVFEYEDEAGNELIYKRKIGDDYKRLTFEGAIGIYKKLQQGEGMTLGFRYMYGFSDIIKDNSGEAQYHNAFNFTLGIPIGKEKAPKE